MRSFARPEGHPRRRVVDVVIESLEKELHRSRNLGISLSLTFFFFWMGSLLLVAINPGLFGLARAASCQ